MFGLRKSPLKVAKHNSVDPGYPVQASSNPFDNEIDHKHKHDHKQKHNSSRKTSPEPALVTPNFGTNPFDDDEGKTTSSSLYSNVPASTARKNYKNDFRDSGGLENQSVQELENYAVYKSEETTKTVKSCLKIAEDMREDATQTLVSLHQQGEQITRTHMVAADIDHDLSRVRFLFSKLRIPALIFKIYVSLMFYYLMVNASPALTLLLKFMGFAIASLGPLLYVNFE